MEKVYVLVENYTYSDGYESEIKTTLYSTIEKARKAMKDTIESEKQDSWLNRYVDKDGNFDDDIVVDEGKDSIDIYVDGESGSWDTNIYIEEKEVL